MASLGRNGPTAPGQVLVTGLPCPDWTDWDTGLPTAPGLPSPKAGLAVCTSAHTHVSVSVLKDTTLQEQCLVFCHKSEALYTQSLNHVTEFCVHLPVSSSERISNTLDLVILKQFLTA